MAEAVSGLVKQLRADRVDVTVVLPDYGAVTLADETATALKVPRWAGTVTARTGALPGVGQLTLIDGPGIQKPHPYNDEVGKAFPDNDLRFFAFCAGVAALTATTKPDVLHLNDWHSAATLGLLDTPPPSLLSVHTLGYQGITGPEWLERLNHPELFTWYGDTNPLLGAIQLADRVVTVSPNYAAEILSEHAGMGLHQHLAQLGDRLVGIINGIDAEEWNPETDLHIQANFSADGMRGKVTNRNALARAFGISNEPPAQPIIGMVTRLVEQKGIDIAIDAARFLDRVPARLVVLGSGDRHLADALAETAARHPGRIGFVNDYDHALSHLIFAGADMLLMPSRFEPCGLAQMQAMTYGTIPIVTDVGGLHDTVIDDDVDPDNGTGFVSRSVDPAGMVDAVHRACRAWQATKRRAEIRRRGMAIDWSWAGPAQTYLKLYREIAAR
jgi:starch synthase